MKIISLPRRKGWKFWLLVALPMLLLGVALFFPAPNDYPISDVVINPYTGKYDSALASWVTPITSASPDDEVVTIQMGDRGGAADSIEGDILIMLSPVIRMHPKAKIFSVEWEMIGGSTFDPGQQLVYHRDSGEVFYHERYYFQEKLYDRNHLVATGVKDRQIHTLAARIGSFHDLKNSMELDLKAGFERVQRGQIVRPSWFRW